MREQLFSLSVGQLKKKIMENVNVNNLEEARRGEKNMLLNLK